MAGGGPKWGAEAGGAGAQGCREPCSLWRSGASLSFSLFRWEEPGGPFKIGEASVSDLTPKWLFLPPTFGKLVPWEGLTLPCPRVRVSGG